jgi:hypothetical protein
MHPNEQMQYTFQPQSIIQSHRDQEKAKTYVVLDHA